MIDAARDAGIPVVVDPKGDDYSAYHRADLLTSNRKEFEQVAGRLRNDSELERRNRWRFRWNLVQWRLSAVGRA